MAKKNSTTISIFYNICGDFWMTLDVHSNLPIGISRFPPPDTSNVETAKIVDAKKIEKITGIKTKNEGEYFFLHSEKYIAFQLTKGSFLWPNKNDLNTFKYKCKYAVEKFRVSTRERLIASIFNQNNDLEKTLSAVTQFTFCKHFSFWLYNPYTKHFHLFCSSFDSEKEVVSVDDKNSTLSEMLEPRCQFIQKNIVNSCINSVPRKGMKTVNRFKITVFDAAGEFEVVAVLSLYSEHEGFVIKDETRDLVDELVKLKYSQQLSKYISSYNTLLKDLAENYKPGNLFEFIEQFAKKLRHTLGYESAAILLVDNGGSVLKLRAISEHNNSVTPDPIVCYDTKNDSYTSRIYNTNEIKYSYNIETDPINTHTYDEKTKHKAKNWIGVPISVFEGNVYGVLRVKNKIDGANVVPFNKIDIDILKDVASVIAYMYSLEISFIRHKRETENKLIEQQQENKEINEYIKTYRHEIKSPLIVVTQAANTLKRALAAEKLVKENKVPKKVLEVLDDLDMVGNRLVFVTNVLTFDAYDLVKDVSQTLIFKDIVAPILAFATYYAKKRHKTISVNKDSLFLPRVLCDANAASMVFHIIIDNAIKYTQKGAGINIFGRSGNKSCTIVVESYGFPILEEEKTYIFEKFARGYHAKEQKTEGSGIGLFLAAQIMRLNNGSLKLTKLSNPTTFEIEINLLEKSK